ncbi:TonB family protein [Castellaniella sp.]|uniref:energy transducer TonB n=1 Tax=Castellaniella sp. TaxID=1955812 RepID=UPI003C74B4C7
MRFPWLKAAAAVAALGLHAAVLAMILSAPVAQVALGQPDALDVQFVELGPAADPAPAAPPAAELPDIPEPEPMVEPDPEPVIEPIPEPEPVVDEPEPDAITEAPPPKPVVKPKPKAQPKPKPKPQPRPKPARETPPAATSATQTPAGGAPQAAQARGEAQAVDPDRPRTIGRVDYLGRRPSPAYPRLSQRRGEQGRVVLRVLISPQGQVAHVKVQHSSGYARLDEAAVQAMQQARFRPYTENGIAYKALVDIPFDFVL